MGERPHLDVGADQATERRRERGHADVPVAGVGDHDHVGAELVVVLAQQRDERVGADLLLALDEHHEADRQVVAERPRRGQVGGDSGLVVGGTATVEAAAALGRLPRRGVPVGVVVLGLHVVVGVEQHRRRARRAGLVGDHRRRPAVRGRDLDPEALGLEERGHRLGAALDLARPLRVGAHGLDPDQVLEVTADAGEDVLDAAAELVDVHAPTLAIR